MCEWGDMWSDQTVIRTNTPRGPLNVIWGAYSLNSLLLSYFVGAGLLAHDSHSELGECAQTGEWRKRDETLCG